MSPQCPAGHASETADFCSECGKQMTPDPTTSGQLDRCPNCGSPPGSLTMCMQCGHSLTSTDLTPPWEEQRWEIMVRPDRQYFDSLEHDEVEFPEDRASRRIELLGDHVSIGRRSKTRGITPEIDLSGALDDDGVSRRHAVLMRQPEGHWALVDQDSTNGTLVNPKFDDDEQEPISANQPVPLSDGDTIFVGYWTKLSVERVDRDEVPRLDVESRPSQDTRNIARRRRPFEVDVLGPLRLRVRGEEVPITASQARKVLTLLALRIGTVVSTADIESAVWGESLPETANKAMQNHIVALRRLLDEKTIETTAPGYRLVGPKNAVDAFRFRTQCGNGRDLLAAGHPGAAVNLLTRALDLWRGDPLIDLADSTDWAAETSSLLERRASAEEDLFEGRLQLGAHHELVPDLSKAVDAEPLRERRWAQLMLALYRCNRQKDALDAYDRLRDQLADRGLVPAADLDQLDNRIRIHDPSLQWTPPSEAGQTPSLAVQLMTG